MFLFMFILLLTLFQEISIDRLIARYCRERCVNIHRSINIEIHMHGHTWVRIYIYMNDRFIYIYIDTEIDR